MPQSDGGQTAPKSRETVRWRAGTFLGLLAERCHQTELSRPSGVPASSLGPCDGQTCPCAFGSFDALLFGQGRHDPDHSLPEDAAAIEERLREGSEANTIRFQSVKVLERLQYALTAETVESPEQHQIEPTFGSIGEHALELGTIRRRARLLVHVVIEDLPALFRGKLVKLLELVLIVRFVVLTRQ